ncbi:hypothetical protein PPYR_03471 [Photinus pyralis]|uniref:THAP-type domain-containing protein n=1 Tax=Photinus pyralis TaxID=7054 RepID=A0A5N4A2Z3_PHOPY|nr:hypothetical protein PPYR_03471 [Photinus pyralis]
MVKNCCFSTCKSVWNPYADISFFSFPRKNDPLMQEWIKVVPTNRKITANSTANLRVCNLHFPKESIEQKCGKRILKKDAIPTIFVVQERTVRDSSLAPPTRAQNEENEVVGFHSVGTQVSPHHLKPSAKEAELQKRVEVLQGQLRRREKRLLTMSLLIKELRESGTSSDALEEVLTSKFSGFNLELFRHQAKNSVGKKRRSYSDEMKEFVSTMYFYSPKAYAYVRKQLTALPHKSTLRKWVAEYSCKPGFVLGAFEYVKVEGVELEDVTLLSS